MINMLKFLMDKVESRQQKMGNVNREVEILRRTKRKCKRYTITKQKPPNTNWNEGCL